MIIQVLIHTAAIQNYTGAYIIMDCLQAHVINLLVWQRESISPTPY